MVNDLMQKANIPERHGKFFVANNQNKTWMNKYEFMKEHLQNNAIYAFCGQRGTGKTQMAVCLIRHFCHTTLKTAKYCSIMDFFIDLKLTYNKNGHRNTEAGVVAEYSAPELLVMDECHERGETNWENIMFTYLIDKRYMANKCCTILICNQPPDTFKENIGFSITDRMADKGGAITFIDVPNFRRGI